MPTAMVTFNGRITLPTQVRKQLGLKTGDSVNFVEVEKGRFAIVSGTRTARGLGDSIPAPVQIPIDRELKEAAV